jgi:exopolysaccharide biosynthesis polyprenyl glycosylphosphotransferase
MTESNAKSTVIKPSWRLRPNERRSTLILVDLLIAALALLIALYTWANWDDWLNFSMQFLQERVPTWFYVMPILWMILLVESYNPRAVTHRNQTIRDVSIAAGVLVVLYLVLFFISEPNSLPRRGVAVFIISVYVLTLIWRLTYIRLFTAPQFMRRVLIVGAGRAGIQLAEVIRGIWPPPFYLVGFVDDDPEKLGKEFSGYKVVGESSNLLEIAGEYQVTDLVFAISGPMNQKTFDSLMAAEELGIEITSMPAMYEELLQRVPIFLLQSDWLLRSFVDQAHAGGFYDLVKRLVDLLGGFIGTLAFAVTFPLLASLILLTSGRPIFYKQIRTGKNGRPYQMIKYRTMVRDAEGNGIAVPAAENDERTTAIGRVLRKMHLDEMPQFLNVLRSEMSLVGPRAERPEIIEQLQREIPFYRARLLVKPGLTGWAQINYGYAAGPEMNSIKLEYDLYYIKHRNLMLDLLIMVRTIWTVIFLRGR